MRDFSDDVKALRARLSEAEVYLRVEELRRRQPQLETEASRPDLWDDADAARAVTGELAAVNADLELFDGLVGAVDDAEVLAEMAREEGDESQEPEIADSLAAVSRKLDELELRSLFSGEHDERDALCSLSSGEGGADAQDWTEMLLRMYLRWAEGHGFDVELEDSTPGERGRLFSAEFVVKGRYAYGWLKAERGVHRLVRMSPFNAQGKRQTAFAALNVVPMLHDGDKIDVEIDEADIQMDVFRVLGRGRPAHQQDVVGRAAHPQADRHRRVVPGGAQPAAEPGEGDDDAQGPAGRRRAPAPRGRAQRHPGRPAARSGSAARSAATCCSRTRW